MTLGENVLDSRKHLLLLVDDQPSNLRVLDAALREDYRIKLASDGELALELATQSDTPDLILLDLMMPGMSGYEVLNRLRLEPLTRKIPVLIVTADTSEESELSGLEMGADDYITKPVVVPLLQARVRNLLRRYQIERALYASEHNLMTLLEVSPVAIFQTDRDGRCHFVNPLWSQIVGLSFEQIEAPCCLETLHPQDRKAVQQALCHTLRSGERFQREFRFLSNERLTWVLGRAVAIRDPAGEITGMVGTLVDISQRKQAELALAARQAYLSSLIAAMNDMVFVIDTAGRINEFHWPVRQNDSVNITETLTGQEYHKVLPCSACEILDQALVHLLEGGTKWQGHFSWPIQGEEFIYHAQITPVINDSTWPSGYLCVARDITEDTRRQNQNRLLSAALENTANAVIITNPEAVIEWCNPAFTNLSGYTREEAMGRRPSELVKSGIQDQFFYEELWQTIRAGRVWHGELVNRRKSGELYHEELTITPVWSDEGELRHFVAIKQDISQRKAHEAEIARLSQFNELLLNAAGEGIYGVDINGICMFINPAATRMLGLSQQEVIGRNQHQLFHYKREDGSPYLEEHCPIYQTLQDGQLRSVEDFFVSKSGAMFPVLMTVTPMRDRDRLVGAEVLFQDISSKRAMEQDLLRLAVTDSLTGIANRRRFLELLDQELARSARFHDPVSLLMMDLDHFKRINDHFGHAAGDVVLRHFVESVLQVIRKVDVFGRLGGEEFGLLLPCTQADGAREIAERLRKTIESQPVTFLEHSIFLTVSIGIAMVGTQEANIDALLARADAALYSAKHQGRNQVTMSIASEPATPETMSSEVPTPRILLVEDNRINQEVALGMLGDVGLIADVAEQGERALELAKLTRYDLILMDLQMPVVDGYQTARAIRVLPDYAKTPIVAMTANSLSSDREACWQAGMNDHIGKPVYSERLREVLERWLPRWTKGVQHPPSVQTLEPAVVTEPAAVESDLRRRLAAVNGINLELGLRATRGRVMNYARLLRGFIQDTDLGRLKGRLLDRDLEHARREAHSLKGLSGTLGLIEVKNAAAELETQVRESAPDTVLLHHFVCLERCYREVAQATQEALGADPLR